MNSAKLRSSMKPSIRYCPGGVELPGNGRCERGVPRDGEAEPRSSTPAPPARQRQAERIGLDASAREHPPRAPPRAEPGTAGPPLPAARIRRSGCAARSAKTWPPKFSQTPSRRSDRRRPPTRASASRTTTSRSPSARAAARPAIPAPHATSANFMSAATTHAREHAQRIRLGRGRAQARGGAPAFRGRGGRPSRSCAPQSPSRSIPIHGDVVAGIPSVGIVVVGERGRGVVPVGETIARSWSPAPDATARISSARAALRSPSAWCASRCHRSSTASL